MNGWFIRLIMSYTSFTIHLPKNEMQVLESIMSSNPEFSRNGIVKMCIREYANRTNPILTTSFEEIEALKRHINALHKQNNPDWKRKKTLPYHFEDEYAPIKNYTDYHGE